MSHPRVQGVITREGVDISGLCNEAADTWGFPPLVLVACGIAESYLSALAAREAVWPDVSYSVWQQTVKWASGYGVGDGSDTTANRAYVRQVLSTDLARAADIAAQQLGFYWRRTQSWQETLARYNGGGGASWATMPAGNRSNYERAWAQAAAYVVEGDAAMDTHDWAFPVAEPHDYADRHWDGLKAVDIFCPAGTPLVAVQDGRATVADYPNGGHTVHLATADGYLVYYAHLIQGSGVGGAVRRGQRIGLAGNTGNAATTPPHCHWAVGTQAYGIDNQGAGNVAPWPWLRAIEATAADDGPEEESPVRIAELEARLAETVRAAGIALAEIDAVLAMPRLPTKAREKLQHGAKPAAETAARGGLPEE